MSLFHSLNTLAISSGLEVKVQWKSLLIKPFVPIDTAFENFDQQTTFLTNSVKLFHLKITYFTTRISTGEH